MSSTPRAFSSALRGVTAAACSASVAPGAATWRDLSGSSTTPYAFSAERARRPTMTSASRTAMSPTQPRSRAGNDIGAFRLTLEALSIEGSELLGSVARLVDELVLPDPGHH